MGDDVTSEYEQRLFVLDEAIRGELMTRGVPFDVLDDWTASLVTIVREHLPPDVTP